MMPRPYSPCVRVLTLITRTGHPALAEIRQRACQTLRFKVQAGLLAVADLVHEDAVLQSLLRWLQLTVGQSDGTGAGGSQPGQQQNDAELLRFVLGLLAEFAQVRG